MSKRKLLLADDSITIQKVVNLTFADEGIEVITVGDGDSAMRKFDDFMPDLVMADVNMPGINGYEVCRIIKQTEETRHIPVILLVGSFEPFDESEAKDVGADDYLTKPFQSIRQLVNKVTDLLNRRDVAPPAPQAAEETAPPSDNYADTLEFENRNEPTQEFGDAGMDDEMIEASPAQNYISDADSVYQRETTIDYAKTQPLNADDLKGFNIVSGNKTDSESRDGEENRESFDAISDTEELQEPLQTVEERARSSEPPSFDEEAQKLGYYEPYEETRDRSEYAEQETPNFNEYSLRDEPAQETPDNLSETEPQIDYALQSEPEFEKELTDAETLEPDVSDAPEAPREADFSQADEEESEAVQEESESQETAEISDEPMSESDFAAIIQPPQSEETEAPTEAESEAEETENERSEAEEPARDEAQFEPEDGLEPADETEDAPPEMQTAASFSDRNYTPEPDEETSAPATDFNAATEQASEPEMIDETPISSTAAEMPPIDFEDDDDDLLDLSPLLVEETGIRPQPKPAALVPEVMAPQQQTSQALEQEPKITVTKTVAESEIALSFPPELIEAIAQKVADKISANTMNDVLPQLADLVVKKLAEQRKE